MQNLCIGTVAVFPRGRKQDKNKKTYPEGKSPPGISVHIITLPRGSVPSNRS